MSSNKPGLLYDALMFVVVVVLPAIVALGMGILIGLDAGQHYSECTRITVTETDKETDQFWKCK